MIRGIVLSRYFFICSAAMTERGTNNADIEHWCLMKCGKEQVRS